MYQNFYFETIIVEAKRYFKRKRIQVDNNPEEFKQFENPYLYKQKLVEPELKIKKEVNQIKLRLSRKLKTRKGRINKAKKTKN